MLTVRRKPDGTADVHVTSLALGLVSSFSLAAPAAADAGAKSVLLVDDDQVIRV
jgi:hypothetical protein